MGTYYLKPYEIIICVGHAYSDIRLDYVNTIQFNKYGESNIGCILRSSSFNRKIVAHLHMYVHIKDVHTQHTHMNVQTQIHP